MDEIGIEFKADKGLIGGRDENVMMAKDVFDEPSVGSDVIPSAKISME